MEISNNDIARILGNIEAKMDAQMKSSERHEQSLLRVEKKLTERADGHETRLRMLEASNQPRIAESVQDHEDRLQLLERDAVRTGIIAGIGSSVGVAVIVEIVRRKMGL